MVRRFFQDKTGARPDAAAPALPPSISQTSECWCNHDAQVRELLHKRIRDTFLHPQFNTDVMKPLNIEALLDQEVRSLSCLRPSVLFVM